MPKKTTHEATGTHHAVNIAAGRIIALDLGRKRVGLAVSDELRITVRPLEPLLRTSWKTLLRAVAVMIKHFDARALVIGLPLNLNGSESAATTDARRIARNFELSLDIPVYLQDERLTSIQAEENLRNEGFCEVELRARVDGESAAIILHDFLADEMNANSPDPTDS